MSWLARKTHRTQSAELNESFEREVLQELLLLHATVLKRMPLVQTLLVIGLGILFFPHIDPVAFFSWSMITIGLECLRAIYAQKILQGSPLRNRNQAHRKLIVLAAISGLTVGASAMLFMAKIPLIDQMLLSIILLAIPAAGVPVAIASRPILAVYSLLIIAPTSFSWIWLHTEHFLPVFGLASLYWGFILSISKDGEQLLRRSITIRQERDRIVKDLELRNAEVNAAVIKAEQASRGRTKILASASHDLRQPLHALSIYSAILKSKPPIDKLPEIAFNINRLVDSLSLLLHGLLDLSRLSVEHYVPERKMLALDTLIEDVCAEYASSLKTKQLNLVLSTEPITLLDDSLAITRIVRNLLDNAIKYTVAGEIHIHCTAHNGMAILTIEDTGKGIAHEEQHRIFEEFYQLDNPDRDYSKGVGLGLAIVHQLCELIHASISLSSIPGTGSKFIISFQSVLTNTKQLKSREKYDPLSLQDLVIYLVDDELDILNSTQALLETWNTQVKPAQSSEAVEALFKLFSIPDLMIVDLRLQDAENGIELAQRLQKVYGEFPVIVVTDETASEAFNPTNAKAFPILHKPIKSDSLFEAICRLKDEVTPISG